MVLMDLFRVVPAICGLLPPRLCPCWVMDVDGERPAPHQTKKRNPTACPFFNFCTEFNEEALNIAPLDIAARRPRKDQFNNPLMPPFHFL